MGNNGEDFKTDNNELNEAKFKLPKDQKKKSKRRQKVRKTLDIRYGEDKRGKVHVYIDEIVSMGDPYMNMKISRKRDEEYKNVIRQMSEENISKEEILGVINEINI